MKEPFDRFVVRYLTAVLLGITALLLHDFSGTLPWRVVLPCSAAPWEVSKLAYWPMLLALLPASGLTGEENGLLSGPVVSSAALFAACWLLSGLDAGWKLVLPLWMTVTAIGTAMPIRRGRRLWPVLTVVLGVLYVLFAILPPIWGPFLDPHSALAMAQTRLPC